jgi:hypothetical protein
MNDKELAKQSGLVQYDSDSKMIDAENAGSLIEMLHNEAKVI